MTRRAVHPGAWWLWAAALAAAASRTTNPLLLALLAAVAGYVVVSCRPDAPWARSYAVFLRIGLVVVAFRVVLHVAFGARIPGTTLFTLPAVDLPEWAAGVSVGGPVTAEGLARVLAEGLRLAVILACFGAANSLASPYRLLRALPAVLYEAGVVTTVALSFAPEAVAHAGRVRDARRLRGRPTTGLAGARGLAVPVLEGALERSVLLAESMDARGYGRRAPATTGAARAAVLATGAGLLAVCAGLYGLLDASSPAALGLPLVGAGAAAAAFGLFARGRDSVRTRYRPDPWGAVETVVVASGAVALLATFLAGWVGAPLQFAPTSLTWPELPVVAAAGALVALVPAFVADRRPWEAP